MLGGDCWRGEPVIAIASATSNRFGPAPDMGPTKLPHEQ